MTIRIHEADGTPYEHIVDIKDANTRFEIPYNTKYKRLKRNRRQRDRVVGGAGGDDVMENTEDALLYCLGDVLQTQDEVAEWRLTDWSKEDEDRMAQESYEWIRIDADFEWICKMNFTMPPYMFVSQLQQDRDVVAQIEVSGQSFCEGKFCLLTLFSPYNTWQVKKDIRSCPPFSPELLWIDAIFMAFVQWQSMH